MEPRTLSDRTIADAYYMQLPSGSVTQGDIWTDLPSGSAQTSLCAAVIITPRCDFAHSKSPVINYLPIITLNDYMLSVGGISIIQRFIAESRETLRRKSVELGVDAYFELDLPIDEIIQVVRSLVIPADGRRSKTLEASRIEFERVSADIASASRLLSSTDRLTMTQLRSFATQKLFDRVQRDLIRNNNVDTYFLPPCQSLIETSSVVLLRHIYTCPIALLERGPASSGRATRYNKQPTPQRLLRINSPFLESLMSKFAALFTRVGTRDIPEAAVNSFAIPYREDAK